MKKVLIAQAIALSLIFGCSSHNVCIADEISNRINTCNFVSVQEKIINLNKINSENWLYNADEDVYYKIGINYCKYPVDLKYQTLAIFVPGKYMTATYNSSGLYSCNINPNATVGNYTAKTAPIVIPVNTPGYMAMASLADYSSVKKFTDEGFIYVHSGCRGRNEGAPAGITDLKAAVRFLRYSKDTIPGNVERIFTFGMSGGGAQSALMGTTGDSSLYEPYLKSIGAVENISDSVYGSMCWCPITNLDTANEAYEWMMGSTRKNLTKEQKSISDKLSYSYANMFNASVIKDRKGNILSLEPSDEGIYQSGNYYNCLKEVIEDSLNKFISDTSFPYEVPKAPSFAMGIRNGEGVSKKEKSFEEMDNIARNEKSSEVNLSGRYEILEDYLNAFNKNVEWIKYDKQSNKATITSIKDFVQATKIATKNIGAFDQLDAGQGENTLFGYGDGKGAHFDKVLYSILCDLNNKYVYNFKSDLFRKDFVGNTAGIRLKMYTPLYYLLESSKGYKTSKVAKYWRIRTGIFQSDCALCTELNLALALANYDSVASVDFETVWGQYHTKAERKGESDENFIKWVHKCMEKCR